MRFVLVDEARRRLSHKRDGVDTRAEIPEDCADPVGQPPEDVLAVHGALERLAKINPRYEQLVEMRYFAGLSVDETAEALGVSRPTVVRDWRAARTWLYGELQS
jgi:RNA polymerase sigma-70 factor (ECF subfamily)